MQYGKTTKLTMKADKATGISSSLHGSNLDALGFNISFILSRKPKLAVKIIKMYDEAIKIDNGSGNVPDEDFNIANKELKKTIEKVFDN